MAFTAPTFVGFGGWNPPAAPAPAFSNSFFPAASPGVATPAAPSKDTKFEDLPQKEKDYILKVNKIVCDFGRAQDNLVKQEKMKVEKGESFGQKLKVLENNLAVLDLRLEKLDSNRASDIARLKELERKFYCEKDFTSEASSTLEGQRTPSLPSRYDIAKVEEFRERVDQLRRQASGIREFLTAEGPEMHEGAVQQVTTIMWLQHQTILRSCEDVNGAIHQIEDMVYRRFRDADERLRKAKECKDFTHSC